jgi:hypothetical protein
MEDACGVCGGTGLDIVWEVAENAAYNGVWPQHRLGIAGSAVAPHQAAIESAMANGLQLSITHNGTTGLFTIYDVDFDGTGTNPDLAIFYLDLDDAWVLTEQLGGAAAPGDQVVLSAAYCDCEGGVAEANYDCDGVCLNDGDGDGVCDEDEVFGCTDETACNYDASATDDDGSCIADTNGPTIVPQDIELELGPDGMAFISTPALLAEPIQDDCGNVLYGSLLQTDFSCSDLGSPVVVTIISEDSNNNISYATATVTVVDPNGYCQAGDVEGCTYEVAVNFDPEATLDNGTCEFAPTSGGDCPDLDGDGQVTTSDLLSLLASFGDTCD